MRHYIDSIDIPLVDLNQLCTHWDIRCITERENQFLKEYCKVLKPVCMALDILQSEDDCFYGTLQPTLEILMAKILALKEGLSHMMADLPDLIVQAIKTRFSTILDSDEALLAAVTLPKFKLRWLRDETRKDTIKMTLAAQCRARTLRYHQKSHCSLLKAETMKMTSSQFLKRRINMANKQLLWTWRYVNTLNQLIWEIYMTSPGF